MAVTYSYRPIAQTYNDEGLTVPASNGTKTISLVRMGFHDIKITAAADSHLLMAPRIACAFFYDESAATGSEYIDLLDGDNSLINRHVTTGTTGTTLDAMTTSDFIYIGADEPFIGIFVDVTAASVNGDASVMTVKYSKNDGTWADTSATDGTASGGATLAQDGNITWTLPTDWDHARLEDQGITRTLDIPRRKLYWVQISVGTALDADVSIDRLGLFHEVAGVNGFHLEAGVEYDFPLSKNTGALEIIADAVSATTADVAWVRYG